MTQLPKDSLRYRSTREAFTLIEMIVVVLIMGVLWSVAMPKFTESIDQQRVRAAAFRLAAELNLARNEAKIKGSSREVSFNEGQNRYDLLEMTHPDKPTAIYRVEMDEGSYPVDLTEAKFYHATGNESTIKFDMYGRPLSKDLPLVSTSLTIQSGSAFASIVVDPVTGKASVQ